MPSDPVVWTADTVDGRMKHTFTGLRPSFPNQGIHYIIMDKIGPVRVELMTRNIKVAKAAVFEDELTRYCKAGLQSIQSAIQQIIYERGTSEAATLEQLQKQHDDFVTKIKDKATTLETLAAMPDATHSDKVLGPASTRIATIHFDWTGENDPDWAQPTPGRVPNTDLRALIIGLDQMIVRMSQSPSADATITVNENDAADWIAQLANLYTIVKRAASKQEPYNPSGVTRSQLDSTWNADGRFDPLVNAGSGEQAEPTGGSGAVTPA